MTKEQAIQKLRELQKKGDQGFEEGISVLCEFLTALGYADVVEEFDKL
jgi:hypothetical protein